MLRREPFRALRDKVHMRAIAQNLPRCPNRVPQPFNTPDAAGTQGRAIHNERIELYFAVAVQKAATASVKGFVIFHDNDSFLNRVERRPAGFKYAPASSHGIANAIEMGFDHVIGNGPGTAMNYQNRISQEQSSREKRKVG